jgi:hypothetical protein
MRLCNPNPAYALKRMRAAKKVHFERYTANVLPIVREVQAADHTSFNAIGGQLNARKVQRRAVAVGPTFRCARYWIAPVHLPHYRIYIPVPLALTTSSARLAWVAALPTRQRVQCYSGSLGHWETHSF